MFVCVCNHISQLQLANSWAETNPDLERLAESLGFYSENCCGRCADEIDSIVDVAERRRLHAGSLR